MTYVNHRDTENTKTHRESLGSMAMPPARISHREFDLRASFVFSVSLWLTYVITEGVAGMTDWSGVGTALVTPFTATGAVDERALAALVERQVRGGVHFVVPCGTTGETPTLSRAEREPIVRLTVEVCAGKVPVLAGVGGYDTAEVADLAHATEALRCSGPALGDAVLQQADAGRALPALPRDRRQDVAADHRLQRARPHGVQRRAADAGAPGRDPQHRRRQGSVRQHAADVRGVPRRARQASSVLCGDDALALPLMAVGGRGVISVASNLVPDRMARLVNAALAGDFDARAGRAPGPAAADAGELHRVQPDSGESGPGDARALRSRCIVCRWCRPPRQARRGFARRSSRPG